MDGEGGGDFVVVEGGIGGGSSFERGEGTRLGGEGDPGTARSALPDFGGASRGLELRAF